MVEGFRGDINIPSPRYGNRLLNVMGQSGDDTIKHADGWHGTSFLTLIDSFSEKVRCVNNQYLCSWQIGYSQVSHLLATSIFVLTEHPEFHTEFKELHKAGRNHEPHYPYNDIYD